MQKLTKELVKNLIYEALQPKIEKVDQTGEMITFKVTIGDTVETHEVKEKDVERFLDKYPEDSEKNLTLESIDEIIRQEVKTFFEVK